MKLVVHEYRATPLSQVVTPSKKTLVSAIRPHLYRHGNPTGTLVLTIEELDGTVLGMSEPLDLSDIGSNNYFHGYIRFDVTAFLQQDVDYRIKLTASDYSFSESNYIGWCNGYDLGKYAPAYTPLNDLHEPLDLEIWARSLK